MPVVSSTIFTWSRALLRNLLGTLSGATTVALTVTPTLVLITDSNPITFNDAVGNHTVADFTGYGAATFAWGGPVNAGADGEAAVAHALFTGSETVSFTGNNITGYLITNGTTTFYGGELFQTPVPIAAPGDYLDLTVLAPLEYMAPSV